MYQRESIAPSADEELVNLFVKTGDAEVLGELYRRYMQLVYGVCLKYLRDRDLAKETVMKVFEKLMIDLPSANVKVFKPWLYVVTKNYCLMELRSCKSSREREKICADNQPSFMEQDDSLHPISENDNRVVMDALQDCITRLNEQQRSCIEMFYFQELTYQQIAESTSTDLNKVKSFIQNGKRNLKICLEHKAL